MHRFVNYCIVWCKSIKYIVAIMQLILQPDIYYAAAIPESSPRDLSLLTVAFLRLSRLHLFWPCYCPEKGSQLAHSKHHHENKRLIKRTTNQHASCWPGSTAAYASDKNFTSKRIAPNTNPVHSFPTTPALPTVPTITDATLPQSPWSLPWLMSSHCRSLFIFSGGGERWSLTD